MSINNSYFTVEWPRLESAPKNNELAGFLFNALEMSEEWLAPVPFGNQIDRYYFESWSGLMEFNDWFREARENMDPQTVDKFSSLYMEIGLLHRDDTYAPAPIKRGFEASNDWLLAAIPPEEVAVLAEKARSIDLKRVEIEFQNSVNNSPCGMVPDGATIVRWISSLADGLDTTAKSGRGIIMGAA